MNFFDFIYSDIPPSRAVTVYLYLAQKANSDGQCWPSERRIVMDLSVSRMTVKRAIDDLVKNRYIGMEKCYRKNGAKSFLLLAISDF